MTSIEFTHFITYLNAATHKIYSRCFIITELNYLGILRRSEAITLFTTLREFIISSHFAH